MRIRRILFTGDVLRPSGDTAGDWLRRILGGPVAAACGLPLEQVAPGQGFDQAGAYAFWGAERSWRGWAAIAGGAAAPKGVLNLFAASFGESVVIGFGMAEVSKRILSRLGIPFLDLAIHPVGFLEDAFFAVQTNDADVFAAMLPHHAEASRFVTAAGLLSAARGGPSVGLPSPTLFVGQRGDDPLLLHDGAFTDFSRFPEEVARAAGSGGVVAFRPHPSEPGDLGLFMAGVPYTSLRIVEGDFHDVLASGAVERVVGLSSPKLTEARYFGCQVQALLGEALDLAGRAADAEPGQSLSIVDEAFEPNFWRDVLAPLTAVTRPEPARWSRPPGSLRGAYARLRRDADASASDAPRRDAPQAET